MKLVQEGPYRFRIEPEGVMRVPGVVFTSPALLPQDESLAQVANVAALPGIATCSYAMPDVHLGYGFPIGGVAATDTGAGGVISPGGVGFDISCGVRLLAADLDRDQVTSRLDRLMDLLGRTIPRGPGRGAIWRLSDRFELEDVLAGGSRYAVERGHGTDRDLERCEDGGAVTGTDVTAVSARAEQRGLAQLGSLGSGNHFLEVQAVENIYDDTVAKTFGLADGQICVMIHCGSRGLGHQICTDHVHTMQTAMPRHGIAMPDRQLACVPVDSSEGRAYLAAMAAAANYGRANRHMLGEATRRAFTTVYGTGLDLIYDVSHNLAKIETHPIGGTPRRLCVHRKGATRALPPGHPDLPPDLSTTGQPALIPGTMGTASYVLVGVPNNPAFDSTCHGAGRRQSRHQAARTVRGQDLRHRLQTAGIAVRGTSWRGLAEEAPTAYKDIDAVIDCVEGAGLSRKIARLVPIGVVKG